MLCGRLGLLRLASVLRRLGLLFAWRGLRLFLMLGGLGLLFMLRGRLLFVLLWLVLSEARSRPEKYEQECCAADSESFHECCLHYR